MTRDPFACPLSALRRASLGVPALGEPPTTRRMNCALKCSVFGSREMPAPEPAALVPPPCTAAPDTQGPRHPGSPDAPPVRYNGERPAPPFRRQPRSLQASSSSATRSSSTAALSCAAAWRAAVALLGSRAGTWRHHRGRRWCYVALQSAAGIQARTRRRTRHRHPSWLPWTLDYAETAADVAAAAASAAALAAEAVQSWHAPSSVARARMLRSADSRAAPAPSAPRAAS